MLAISMTHEKKKKTVGFWWLKNELQKKDQNDFLRKMQSVNYMEIQGVSKNIK